MKKILLSTAAALLSGAALFAQSPAQHDSVRVHVVRNINGNVLDIDTAVSEGNYNDLVIWMQGQGIQMQTPPAGDSLHFMFIEVSTDSSGEINTERMQGEPLLPPVPPVPPMPPMPPGECRKIIMIGPDGKMMPPPAPGDEMQVIVTEDSTGQHGIKRTVVVCPNAKTPLPPSPSGAPGQAKTAPEAGAESLSVYPNPSNGQITIRFDLAGTGQTNITVTDMSGKLVYEEQLGEAVTGPYSKQINIGKAKGTYTVKVRKGNTVLARNIIVE